MSNVNVTPNVVTPSLPTFSVAPRVSLNSARENKSHRDARAKSDFAKGKSFTFLGRLSDELVKQIADGKDVLPPTGKTYLDGKAGKCVYCGGTHSGANSAKTTWYQNVATKAIVTLSDTCRKDYLQVQGIERVLTNPEQYREVFPKAPVR